jgi:N-acetylneuraminic acid mutarotase
VSSARSVICLSAFTTLFLGALPCHAKVASFWKDLPPLLTPRQEVGVVAEGRFIYVIGGILVDRSATGIVERFAVDGAAWEALPALPENTRVHHVGAAGALGLVFAIGGLNASFRGVKSVFAFDPSRNVWERKADMPRGRGAMGVAVIDDKIYAAGGQDGSTSFTDFAVYHIVEDRWEALPSMPTARNHLAAAGIEGIFYAVGGRDGELFGTLEGYEPATRKWVELAPMPTARGGIAAAAVYDCIFVFGGEGNSQDLSGVFPQVEGYDTCRDRWMCDRFMPHPRHGIGAAVLDDMIYIPGGSPVEGFGVTDAVDAYFPGSIGPSGFLRGDANLDEKLDISDALFILGALFLGGEAFGCEDAADTNDDGRIDLSDAVFGLGYLFLGGRPPPFPGPDFPGIDGTFDSLNCFQFPRPNCVDPF